MEEVWKNINITSLPNTPIPHHNPNPNPNPRSTHNYNKAMIFQDFLNCNTSSVVQQQQQRQVVPHEPNDTCYHQMQSFSAFGGSATAPRKRSCESTCDEENNNVSSDRRYKRMIKNRESASRSRARKQAYIMELELEVAHLVEENARLRKQQLQLLEAPSSQVPKKKGLYRTTTAPF